MHLVAITFAFLLPLALVITYYDVRYRRIPNAFVLATLLMGLTLNSFIGGLGGALASLGGCALAFILMFILHVFGAMGAGDVKLFAAIGTLLGPAHIVVAFLYTAIAGGLLAVVVAARRRRLQETMERTAVLVRTGGSNVGEIEHGSANNRFAYAPAIAIGALVAALGA